MNKSFNITGYCIPEQHYMVDIKERLTKIREMIDRGEYFVINRGRQYGKTTTLNALEAFLTPQYWVINMDFQMLSNTDFSTEERFVSAFAREMFRNSTFRQLLSDDSINAIKRLKNDNKKFVLADLFDVFCEICFEAEKAVVLIIDEIDTASNNTVFIDFLSMLRGYYLRRNKITIFKSVILAGVRDIRNLKLKIRDESEHQHNSPWNIANVYDDDMSLSVDGIEGMLYDYEKDHNTGMDVNVIAQLIYDYTSGYPVLVSNICKLLDEDIKKWTNEGVILAVNQLLSMNTPLFDSLINKLEDYPEMKNSLYQILTKGDRLSYNPDYEPTKLLLMFGFVKVEDGAVVIANRLFETRLYNDMLTSEEMKSTSISKAGVFDKPEFVKNGVLDVKLIMSKFIEHFHEIYSGMDDKFIEDDGRKCFLIYLRPIINGVGHYYIEAKTRDNRRMDIVVNYLGQKYIIELKIWHGPKYNEDGEKQLSDYLDANNQKTGYLLTFNFNKNKKVGLKTVQYKDKTIIEAMV